MPNITLVTGGGRSGKSAWALARAAGYGSGVFIATAEPLDDEMRQRIDAHRRERPATLSTIEEPLDLCAAIGRIPAQAEVAVIDCLAVWVGNLMHHRPSREREAVDRCIDAMAHATIDLIVVTNEVGMGIIPDNALSRNYRDLLGTVNQRLAAIAQEVVLMVCGLPIALKGEKR